jgi:GT2 family glycosyltransferase
MSGDRREDPRLVETALRDEVEQLGHIVDEQERTIAHLRRELLLHSTSIGWRLQQRLEPFRKAMLATPVLRHLYRVLYRALDLWIDFGAARIVAQVGQKIRLALAGRDFRVEAREARPLTPEEQYRAWTARQHADAAAVDVSSALARFRSTPRVSVLTVLDDADPEHLRRLEATLRAQGYPHWELCLAAPREVRLALRDALERLQRDDTRIRVAGGDLERASLSECLDLATGEFVCVLDAGDTLAPEAFFELMRRLNEQPDVDVAYSDEDWMTDDGVRGDPLFKPDWSPDLLLSTNYLECVGLFRRQLVDRVGGFRPAAGRAAVYDLTLRLTEASQAIAHVPKVLCHRRRRPTTVGAVLERRASNVDEARVLTEAVARRGQPGSVTAIYARSGIRGYAARYELRERPLVSIIIPTKNKKALLQTTIESIRARTGYDPYEIIVIDNGSIDADAVAYLASLEAPCRVFEWREPFNYSALNNFGVRHAGGEQLLFLNNDVEVIRPDWLHALVEHAQRPEVGAVGGKLLYADGSIQHAGVVVGINRAGANAFRGWPGDTIGALRLADLTRDCSAVTGACMMVPRRVFDEVGGFDEQLRVVLNDVDLCLKVRERGRLVVYTPHALLYHYEGSSRGRLHPPADELRFAARWGQFLDRGDPYYNPNLSYRHDDWRLALEPADRQEAVARSTTVERI